MINFKIDPPSGHAEAYWDVRFSLSYDKSEKAVINLFNKTTKQPIEILGVSSGYIAEETSAIAKNTNEIEGYFNIFNKDKMNKKFSDFSFVEIACEVELQNKGATVKESSSLNFYNESNSLDGDIMPFDLVIENAELDVSQNSPLILHIVCDREKSYEFSIRNHNDSQTCTFTIFTKNGRADILIPLEFIFHELELDKMHASRFDLYYTKFEGIDFSGFMNRKRLRIPNTVLKFNSGHIMPQSQNRLDPTGKSLPSNFVLSDRYFVHTDAEFSAFSSRVQLSQQRMSLFTRFIHESQHMQTAELSDAPKKEHPEVSRADINKAATADAIKTNFLRSPNSISEHTQLLSSLTSVYAAKSTHSRPNYQSVKVPNAFGGNIEKKPGGCGCSRKKK